MKRPYTRHFVITSLLAAVVVVVGSARAQDASPWGEAKSASDALCEGVEGEEEKFCRTVCVKQPAELDCLVFLRFGSEGVAAGLAIYEDPSLTDAKLSTRVGLDQREIPHLRHFLEVAGVPNAVVRPPKEIKELDDADSLYGQGLEAQERGQFDAALEFFQRELVIEKKVYGEEHPVVALTLNNIGGIYYSRGEYDKALEHYRQALAIEKKVYGEEHPDVVLSLKAVGSGHYARKEYGRALEHFRQALSVSRKVLGNRHSEVATGLNNMGVLHLARKEYDTALEYHRKALATRREVHGDDHPDVALSLSNIGSVHHSRGEYDEALEYHRKALAVRKKVHGEEHADVAISLSHIGGAHSSRGEYDRALEHHRQALAIERKVHGEEHPDVATSLLSIGQVHHKRGEYDRALDHLLQALAIYKRLHGEDHPDVAATLHNAGVMRQDRGEYDSALEHYRKALAMWKKVHGEAHPDVAACLTSIGRVQQLRGEYDSALEHHRKALAIHKNLQGEDAPGVATSLNHIGEAHLARGEYDRALEHLHEALAIKRRVYGEGHPEVALSLNSIGTVHLWRGEYDRALEHHREALAINKKMERENEMEVAISLNSIGAVHSARGEYDRALEYYRKALVIMRKVYGEGHPDVATSLNNIGSVHRDRGEYDGALEHYREALAIQKKAYREHHPGVATSLNNIGSVHHARGEYDGALEHYREALAIQKKVYGEEHPDVALTLNNMGAIHANRGEYDSALEHFRKSLAIQEKVNGEEHPYVATRLMNISASLAALGRVPEAKKLSSAALGVQYRHFLANVDTTETDIGIRQFSGSIRHNFEFALSLGRDPAESSFVTSLHWQGLATRAEQLWRDRRRLLDGAKGENGQRLEKHRGLQRERLQLVMSTAETPRARRARDERLAKLDGQIERLENRLAKDLPAFAAQRKVLTAGADEACAALRKHKRGLINYVSYYHFNPNAKLDERWTPSYAAFVVVPKKNGCEFVRHDFAAEKVDAAVDAYRSALEALEACYKKRGQLRSCSSQAAAQHEAAKKLRGLVWDPLEPKLGEHTDVLVVPDGRLLEVSFGALPREDDTYLVEHLELAYLPYPAAVLQQAATRGKAAGAFVAGDLDYRAAHGTMEAARQQWSLCGESCRTLDAKEREAIASRGTDALLGEAVCGYDAQWSQLPATEVTAVAQKLGRATGEPAWLVTGAAAQEQAVKAALAGKRVIHLETHGFYSPAKQCGHLTAGGDERGQRLLGDAKASIPIDPLRLSALVLSGANVSKQDKKRPEEDGVLSARDIVGIDLRGTELVTLAACETGRGSETVGEGSLGLARAFLVAGASAAVVSQWQVPGKKTVAMFNRFYELALQGGSDDDTDRKKLRPAEALRRAQIEQIKHHRDAGQKHSAFLWGAFLPLQNGM